jgi:DNA-binding NarL/FixJ family response regulator
VRTAWRSSRRSSIADATINEPITVLLIEDHLTVRKGLELFLRGEGFRISGVTDSIDEAFRMFMARRPDVVILDLALGEQSGVELAGRVLAADPDAALLIYTGVSDQQTIDRAAACGARGFALKSGGPHDLVKAVQTVVAGGVYVDPGLASLLAPRVAAGWRLTAREREVFALLADGMTGEQAAEKLVVSPETVRTHVRNGMRKLDARTRAHAIAIAVRLREINL